MSVGEFGQEGVLPTVQTGQGWEAHEPGPCPVLFEGTWLFRHSHGGESSPARLTSRAGWPGAPLWASPICLASHASLAAVTWLLTWTLAAGCWDQSDRCVGRKVTPLYKGARKVNSSPKV